MSLKLVTISPKDYLDYRYDVIMNAYKWDPQVEDYNTISNHAIIIDEETSKQLIASTEALAIETVNIENALLTNLTNAKDLALPKSIIKNLNKIKNYDKDQHVRLMRFDFHPTNDGWAISEVNSDVPGGFAEASLLPSIASKYLENGSPSVNPAQILLESFQSKVSKDAKIAFIHCTSYADDRQVMQFLSDYFNTNGMQTFVAAPDHIKWVEKKAECILKGKECKLDAIIRFFPLEWLSNLTKKKTILGYYDTLTTSCNHPVSILTQSKRFPLVYDKIMVDVKTYNKLLPLTKHPKSININEEWICKPALGRVGEGISIKEVISEKEFKQINNLVKKHPNDWIAQKKFISKPITNEEGKSYHLCIGTFAIDGKFAGFYGRISPYARIDANAIDIPILIRKE